MLDEPTTADAVADWIESRSREADLFADVARATAAHRARHGCDAYESGNGALLGILARSIRPSRVLEVGTGLGYGTLWLAHGAGPTASVQTVERDSTHAELAREQFTRHRIGNAEVIVGEDLEVLSGLEAPYDLIFYDANVPTPAHLSQFDRLLSNEGLLVTSNLFLGRYAPDLPGLADGARYRDALFGPNWLTGFANGKALTVRRRDR